MDSELADRLMREALWSALGRPPDPRQTVVGTAHWVNDESHWVQIASAVDALVEISLPLLVDPRIAIFSGEYAFSPARWRGLLDQLALGRLRELEVRGAVTGAPSVRWSKWGSAQFTLVTLRWPTQSGGGLDGSTLRFYDEADYPALQTKLVGAFRSLVERFGSCYAWLELSDSGGGWASTAYERDARLSAPWGDQPGAERVLRWARGVFWGNLIGPRHVEALGGLARIQGEAPVAACTPLANGGVYLQATASLWHAQPDDLGALYAFFRPLLPTRPDFGLEPYRPRSPDEQAAWKAMMRAQAAQARDHAREPRVPRRSVVAYSPSFPVVYPPGDWPLGDQENVFFALRVTPATALRAPEVVRDVLQMWWDDVGDGMFGGLGFNYQSEIDWEDGALTWCIGWEDVEVDALYDLLARLDARQQSGAITVVSLRIGYERD